MFDCVLVGFLEQIMTFLWVKILEFAPYFKFKHNLLYTLSIFLILFRKLHDFFLFFVDLASLYNRVNKANFVHSFY